MKHAIEKSRWLSIEEEAIKSRHGSVENSQDFEKFCQDGDRRWTTAGQVSFVDATHEMRKADDIQNAVDATKNSAAQLQHCQAGLSGLSPIILSKMTRHRLSGLSPIILLKMMTRHTKEITRILQCGGIGKSDSTSILIEAMQLCVIAHGLKTLRKDGPNGSQKQLRMMVIPTKGDPR